MNLSHSFLRGALCAALALAAAGGAGKSSCSGAVLSATGSATGNATAVPADAPRLVNIINFIRQTEPRPLRITDEDLYQTVVEQVRQL
ncbi:MAG: hypothetical protein LBR07_09485, partial [Puniceicoccales bacterium]|nr:hypothetical protein [Puniceicoccales bacterium]